MKPASRAAIAAAQADGRWQAAYHGFRCAQMPKDFLGALERAAGAKAFFPTLNKPSAKVSSTASPPLKNPNSAASESRALWHC